MSKINKLVKRNLIIVVIAIIVIATIYCIALNNKNIQITKLNYEKTATIGSSLVAKTASETSVQFNITDFVTNGKIYAYASLGELFIYNSNSQLIKKIEKPDRYEYGYKLLTIVDDRLIASIENDLEVFNFEGESLTTTHIPIGISTLTDGTISGIFADSIEFPESLMSDSKKENFESIGGYDLILLSYRIIDNKISIYTGSIRQIGSIDQEKIDTLNTVNKNTDTNYISLDLGDNIAIKSYGSSEYSNPKWQLRQYSENLLSHKGSYICNCTSTPVRDNIAYGGANTIRWVRPVSNLVAMSDFNDLYTLSDIQNKDAVLGSDIDKDDYDNTLFLTRYDHWSGELVDSSIIKDLGKYDTSMYVNKNGTYIIGRPNSLDVEIRKYNTKFELVNKSSFKTGAILKTFEYKDDIYILTSTDTENSILEAYKIGI